MEHSTDRYEAPTEHVLNKRLSTTFQEILIGWRTLPPWEKSYAAWTFYSDKKWFRNRPKNLPEFAKRLCERIEYHFKTLGYRVTYQPFAGKAWDIIVHRD